MAEVNSPLLYNGVNSRFFFFFYKYNLMYTYLPSFGFRMLGQDKKKKKNYLYHQREIYLHKIFEVGDYFLISKKK